LISYPLSGTCDGSSEEAVMQNRVRAEKELLEKQTTSVDVSHPIYNEFVRARALEAHDAHRLRNAQTFQTAVGYYC
jgi:hypothetical protein